MASAQLLHLRAEAPGIEGPSASTIVSATAPWAGVLTSRLLDPAAPQLGAAGASNVLAIPSPVSLTKSMIIGRWLTKPLPAQVIGAGNWIIGGMLRAIPVSGTDTTTIFGGCLAQWRTGTGVVARFFDSPTTGAGTSTTTAGIDLVALSTIAGGALTLLAGDALCLEVWFSCTFAAFNTLRTFTFNYGGAAQYTAGSYGYNVLPLAFDPTLLCPAAVTFS